MSVIGHLAVSSSVPFVYKIPDIPMQFGFPLAHICARANTASSGDSSGVAGANWKKWARWGCVQVPSSCLSFCLRHSSWGGKLQIRIPGAWIRAVAWDRAPSRGHSSSACWPESLAGPLCPTSAYQLSCQESHSAGKGASDRSGAAPPAGEEWTADAASFGAGTWLCCQLGLLEWKEF